MLDVIALAWVHHLLAFAVVSLLAAEIALVRGRPSAEAVRLLGRVDLAYGALFAALVLAGLGRVAWTEKGAWFYLSSWPFWSKMAVLGVVSLLSVPPTLRFIRWGRRLRADAADLPGAGELRRVQAFLWAEAGLLLLVPLFAAIMARGL